MTEHDLLTEARELLGRAKTYLDATDGERLNHLLRDGYDAQYAKLVCFSVDHLSEICDELGKMKAEDDKWRENYKQAAENYQQKCRDIAEIEMEMLKAQTQKQKAIEILEKIDWVGSGAKGLIEDVIDTLLSTTDKND